MGLEDFAQAADIGYEQDEVMGSAYFHTGESYGSGPDDVDFARAVAAGLVPEELRSQPDRQITSSQFKAMLAQVVRKTAPDQLAQLDKYITGYETPLTRGMGFVMAYYGAKCIEADYLNCPYDNVNDDSDEFWDLPLEEILKITPHAEDGPAKTWWTTHGQYVEWDSECATAYLFSFWHLSPVTGELLFSFDEKTGTMRQKDPLTVKEAAVAARRLLESAPSGTADVADPAVTAPDGTILSKELLEKANAQPKVTAFDHPDWSGFLIDTSAWGRNILPRQIKQFADWGFNTVSLLIEYDKFFNQDITEAHLDAFKELDALVATAIQNNFHLNITPSSLPGRSRHFDPDDFSSGGDFDLFINTEKQKMADRYYAVFAKRYKDVPSANLSFTPFWEASNKDLSTGAPVPDYSWEDICRYQKHVVDLIHAEDSDRLIIAQSTSPMDRANLWHLEAGESTMEDLLLYEEESEYFMYQHNYVESAFVYASMTIEDGKNIDDNNHSMFAPEYPTSIYSCKSNLDKTMTNRACISPSIRTLPTHRNFSLTGTGRMPR